MTPFPAVLAAGDVISHLTDSYELHFGPWHISLVPINEALEGVLGVHPMFTKHVVMMLLAAAVVAASCILAARRAVRDRGRGTFANMVEATALFLRDEVARPGLGEHHYRAWYPYVATLFFFILGCNLIGLLPPPLGATATGNISVTMALAAFTLFMMVVAGMKEKGAAGFWLGLVPHGVPWWLWPIVFAIEVFGLLTKPFALMVRLAANMTAGHVILAVLAGFLAISAPSVGAWFKTALLVGPPTVGFYLFITIFEIAIAFIQAFVFAYLSSIFIGLSLSHEH